MKLFENVDSLLVDEAQFLSTDNVDQLCLIADHFNISVLCFGLRTDFRTGLFEGSQRLIELADTLEEIPIPCHFCPPENPVNSVLNLKLLDGNPTLDGPQFQLGLEETYVPTCRAHYYEKIAGCMRREQSDLDDRWERSA